ncbi:MAG: DUF393 domain-containing protein [Actinobacteria bacterium]|jgi:hypothetical protein|nr:DUF393 domain-containing protein [Actinomycetota bacterium]
MTNLTSPLFLFDGDCGVCQQGTDRMRQRFAPPVDMASYQSIGLDELGVTQAEVLEGPVLVRLDGSHVVGPLAVAELLRMSRAPYRYAGYLMLAPGIRQALRAAGPAIYRQRHRLPGATSACRAEPAPQDVE